MIRRASGLVVLLASLIATLCLVGPATTAPLLVGTTHRSYQPQHGKIFILVIGNDARFGNPPTARADAIHLVGINTKTMKAGILNFPRDSWVSIPGRGMSKMNEATQAGGPEGLVATIEGLTGIKIDYWVMTGFEGFMGIIDGLGRVQVRTHQGLYDPSGSGIHLPAGNHMLGPKSSLAYLRTRHSFGTGDLARTTNHGTYLISLLRKLRGEVRTNPAALLSWISLTKRHTRFGMTPGEMFRLGVLASQIKPGKVRNVTVPASTGSVGAASVVFISPSARSLYQRFRTKGSL